MKGSSRSYLWFSLMAALVNFLRMEWGMNTCLKSSIYINSLVATTILEVRTKS